jgi:hypothetical protein
LPPSMIFSPPLQISSLLNSFRGFALPWMKILCCLHIINNVKDLLFKIPLLFIFILIILKPVSLLIGKIVLQPNTLS